MTVTADEQKRIVLPEAKPGDQFDLQPSGGGTFVLRPLERSGKEEVKLVKPVPYKGAWILPGEIDMEKAAREIIEERQHRDENLLG